MKNLSKIGFAAFIAISLFSSCKNSNKSTSEQNGGEDLLTMMESSIESAKVTTDQLMKKRDETKKTDEVQYVKFFNSHTMTEENLRSLEVFYDSLKNHKDLITDYTNFKINAKSQTEYLNSLVKAGNLLLENKSFQTGEWAEGAPTQLDSSVVTQVQKVNTKQQQQKK